MLAFKTLLNELVLCDDIELRIRNHALEFVIDGWRCPMKYVLRHIRWMYDRKGVSMMELCTHEESLLREPYENYDHMNALLEMYRRYKSMLW